MQNSNDPAPSEETVSKGSQVEVLLSLETLIKNHISRIDKLQEEAKKQKEMLDDSFNNDPVYKEHAEKAKEAAKVKGATKLQIAKQPSVSQLTAKVKDMTSELKELRNSLSDYLKEYQRMSGATEIEGEDGEFREIVSTVKLVKRASKK